MGYAFEMSEWLDQMKRFPMWGDADRPIELQFADGSVVAGRLWLADVDTCADGEEAPIWRVVPRDAPLLPDEGAGISFFDAERFRFLD
jgi:hypothetical protein